MAEVRLHVYDLGKGYLGDIKLWHSAIYVYDREFEFGRRGILMTPKEHLEDDLVTDIYLGTTDVDLGMLMAYLRFLSKTKFPKEKYSVIRHNCNSFANFLSNQLVGCGIPKYLLNTPVTVGGKVIEKLLLTILSLRGISQVRSIKS